MSDKKAKDLLKKLEYEPKHAADSMSKSDWKKVESLREDYKKYLTACKTEREAADYMADLAKNAGYVEVTPDAEGGRLFQVYRNKTFMAAIIGEKSVEEGVNLVISHIDAPRLDLKQRPMYESCNLALAKTHYYGGIKKYQWVTRPLALHGIAFTRDGNAVPLVIGEKPDDPVLTVLDLLPHLAKKAQYGKKIEEAIVAEKLNVVFGGMPYGESKEKNRFKANLLSILHRDYDLTEEDLVSAELEIVPAGEARDVGLDRGFIGAYGQDDRICAYTSFAALLDSEKQGRTQVIACMDKEEIGSYGNTGAQGRFLLDFLGELLAREGKTDERAIRRAMANSLVLSGDVTAAVDPDWQEVHEKRNAAFTGFGLVLTKFTGSRGKAGASDASAEFLSRIRNLFNDTDVAWQPAEMGKVDEGGGGTVAHYVAAHGAEVLDCGPALLSMHSPMEIVHILDFYMTYKGYKAFLEKV